MAMIFASVPITTLSFRKLRFRLALLLLKMWPRNALLCLILPVAVNLNRFFIPLCVFCLGTIRPLFQKVFSMTTEQL
jgi:hypothetical protein